MSSYSAAFALLALVLSTTAPLAAHAQTSAPAAPAVAAPSTAGGDRTEPLPPLPSGLGSGVLVGQQVSVQGTVVRTSRRNDPSGPRTRLLLAKASGDTVTAESAAEVPPVGAVVVASGMVARDGTGILVVGSPGVPASILVLSAPAPPSRSSADASAAGAAVADPCADVAWLSLGIVPCALAAAPMRAIGVIVLGAGVLFLGLVGFLVVRVRGARSAMEGNTDIALIVDLRFPAAQVVELAVPIAPGVVDSEMEQPERDIISEILSPDYPVVHEREARVQQPGKLGYRALAIPGIIAQPDHDTPEAVTEEGLVQLLPGWLETLQGEGLESEIRFFRVSGNELPEITFGRSPGPMYRHVQLSSPLASPVHARMRYRDRRWTINGLSRAAPVLVNGGEVLEPGEGVVLRDGDEIQLGDVVFRFHEHSRSGQP